MCNGLSDHIPRLTRTDEKARDVARGSTRKGSLDPWFCRLDFPRSLNGCGTVLTSLLLLPLPVRSGVSPYFGECLPYSFLPWTDVRCRRWCALTPHLGLLRLSRKSEDRWTRKILVREVETLTLPLTRTLVLRGRVFLWSSL